MKKLYYLLSFLFIASVALGANVGDDVLTIGKPGSSADKEIKFRGSVRSIRDNLTTGKLEFTQDGSVFKEIGSGSGNGGGGDNFLGASNAGFEDGTDSWLTSGSLVFAVSATDQIGDSTSLQSGTVDTGGAAILRSALVDVPLGSQGQKCSADFRYQWVGGTPANATATIVNQLDSTVATFPDFQATTGTEVKKLISPLFDCNLGTQLQVKIEFTADEPLMKLDQFFLGSEKNQFQLSQTEIYGQLQGDTTCLWLTTATGGYADFNPDATCNLIANGNASVPASNVPQIDFDYLPPGKYLIEATAHFRNDINNATSCYYMIQDETNATGDLGLPQNFNVGSSAGAGQGANTETLSNVFTFTSGQTNKSFKVRAFRSGGTAQCRMGFATGVQFRVTRYPISSAEAVTLETSGWYLDVNLGGQNVDIQAKGLPASYVQIEASTLDLVNNNPSVPVEIACNGVASTGLTCSGAQEVVGFATNVPSAGAYKFCMEFSNFSNSDASGFIENYFQLIETPNNSDTILQEGGSRILSSNDNTGALAVAASNPMNVCGIFRFTSAGKKTIRLMLERSAAANVTTDIIVADRNSTGRGQRDIHAYGYKINEAKPTPVFTDLQNSLNEKLTIPNESGLKECAFWISNSDTPAINFEYGGCVDSLTDTGTAEFRVNFTSGFWDATGYSCFCQVQSNALGSVGCIVGNRLVGSSDFATFNTSSTGRISRGVNIRCVGK